MTILNAWVEPERALVGTDTEGGRGSVGKFTPLVHLNAVLAYRGTSLFSSILNLHCQNPCNTFDELLDRMPAVLKRASAQMCGPLLWITRLSCRASLLDKQTVVLVGWSARAGKMIGRSWDQETRAQGFVAEDLRPHYIAPWRESLERGSLGQQLPDPSTRDEMARLARAQTQLLREESPETATGGRFIVAEIRRDSMTIETACEL